MERSAKIKIGLAATSAFLALLTLVAKDWIEVVFHVDPDGGNGSLEWLIVAVCTTAAIVFGLLARAELRARTT